MNTTPVIVIVDDDEGHALLVRENLLETGLTNPIEHFSDGQEALDFFFDTAAGRHRDEKQSYLVLLDIRMPKVDGTEVLRRLKADPVLRTMLVIMLTTTDDAPEVAKCYRLGCNIYVRKPVDYDRFSETVHRLGAFISSMVIPAVRAGASQ